MTAAAVSAVCRALRLAILAAVCLAPAMAAAQSFDCGKAQAPVDRAICASPRLRQLDTELANAYTSALRRDPARADAVRGAQRSWAGGRAACVAGKSDAEQCLATAYAARLAALGTAAAVQPVAPSTAATAAGLPAEAPPAGTLERDRVPAAGETEILLHVTSPGRFAIRATSATGTALQLVDMLTGPGDRAGWPGKQDGRIDALLDVGTYKLRAFGADGATGEATLALAAFTAAGPAQLAPGYQPAALALRDLQFQSFWLVVGDGPARVEAAGRSLAALKLWRDGRDLVEVPEAVRIIAAPPAHPLTDIVLSGEVAPGTYLVTAYGGPPLPWSDGATDAPLYVRTGQSTGLLAGGLSGQVSVFGSETFTAPPNADRVLLSLPQPADARLRATGPGAKTITFDIAKVDRARATLMDLPARSGKPRFVELTAAPGQEFSLRPLAAGNRAILGRPGVLSVERAGRYRLGVEQPATGGDEAPASALLLRFPPDGTRDTAPQVVASPGVPVIGPGAAWRARFNLRGETALLFQASAPVTVAARTDGPALTARIATLGGAVMNAMGNGATATTWALSPGWYTLLLTPKPQAAGILDLTLGPPGLTPPAPMPAGPENPVLPLGEQSLDAQARFELLTTRAPGDAPNLVLRATPVELGDGPLVETLPANAGARLEAHVRNAGTLVVRDIAGGAALESRAIAAGDVTEIAVPPADHARTIAVALLPVAPAAEPNPAPAPALTALRDGETAFLDLDRDEQASFALTVGQGGLYRVQTTGRLKTAGSIGTSFIPVLDSEQANGVGANMLLQRYLRAGRYRLEVTAQNSAGRLGVSATATPLADGAELLPGGSVRATLAPGRGVAFPIRIAAAGRYHLDVLGDGRSFSARLEDADGWPLLPAGDLSSVDQELTAGRYRLIVEPPSVEARVVARLAPIVKPVALAGHGPHPLPFDAAQSLQWREPPGRDDARAPDLWTFALAGPATVTLSLDGDGMAAAIEGADAGKPPLGRVIAGTPLRIDLPAGAYRVAASSMGRNDRLDYTLTLHGEELQPGVARHVTLPAELPFAIAAPRVVALTSFGTAPLRAELRDAEGRVLARAAGRTDDWNIALSRSLPAGRYRLALTSLAPPPAPAGDDQAAANNTDQGQGSADQDTGDQDQSGPGGSGQDSSGPDSSGPDSSGPDTSGPDTSGQENADNPAPDNSDQAAAKPPPPGTDITLFLPVDQPEVALSADGAMQLAGGGVQHVTLPAAAAGSLQVVAAEAPVEFILVLEQRGRDGWQVLGQSQGLAPIVAVPADATATRRLSVWTVDGGAVPIRIAAQAVTATPAPIGAVPVVPVALDGITQHWNAALVSDPGALMLRLETPAPGLLATSAAGQPAEAPPEGTIVAQSDAVWLLTPGAPSPRLVVVQAASELAIAVPEAGHATLPLAADSLCAAIATSGLGQPGLDAGRGMGVAAGSAFALCGGAALHAWNAGGDAPLRLHLRRIGLAAQPEIVVDQAFAGQVPPHAALPLRLPAGTKRLEVSLAGGEALVAGWQQAGAVTAWAGEAALSRSLTGDWTDALLVNTGDAPAPAALTVTAAPPLALAPGGMFRRFFGAGGSFDLPLTAQPGQRLLLAGNATALVQRPDGQVRQGRAIPLDGPARAVVTHGAGPLALWIEGPGASPWPDAPPRDVTLSQRLALGGEAMALRLTPGAPVLLRLAGTAPAILAIGADPPELFGNGVALARYLPAGETVLRLLSPQDGPLSGSLELSGTPVTEVGEGLGAPVAVPPGGAAVFGFRVAAAGPVGLGVRADPDRVAVRLLDEHGAMLQRGVSMLKDLAPGHYLLEASVPPDAPTTLVRPAVLGIVPHPNPPPPEIIRGLLVAAGFAPPDSAR